MDIYEVSLVNLKIQAFLVEYLIYSIHSYTVSNLDTMVNQHHIVHYQQIPRAYSET